MKKIWDAIKAAWKAVVDFAKRLLKRDAPHLKYGVGGQVYIDGIKYIVVGMSLNSGLQGRHVQVELEPFALYYAKYRYSPHPLKEGNQ